MHPEENTAQHDVANKRGERRKVCERFSVCDFCKEPHRMKELYEFGMWGQYYCAAGMKHHRRTVQCMCPSPACQCTWSALGPRCSMTWREAPWLYAEEEPASQAAAAAARAAAALPILPPLVKLSHLQGFGPRSSHGALTSRF